MYISLLEQNQVKSDIYITLSPVSAPASHALGPSPTQVGLNLFARKTEFPMHYKSGGKESEFKIIQSISN
jgi:hypothetical protein